MDFTEELIKNKTVFRMNVKLNYKIRCLDESCKGFLMSKSYALCTTPVVYYHTCDSCKETFVLMKGQPYLVYIEEEEPIGSSSSMDSA
jgi:hypothetical protein